MSTVIKEAQELLTREFATKLELNESIQLEVKDEAHSTTLSIFVGTIRRAHVFEFKTASDGEEEAKMLLLDFAQSVLKEFFKSGRRSGFSVGFCKRSFEESEIWVREEYRDFELERMAEELLASADGKKH